MGSGFIGLFVYCVLFGRVLLRVEARSVQGQRHDTGGTLSEAVELQCEHQDVCSGIRDQVYAVQPRIAGVYNRKAKVCDCQKL